MLPNVAKCQGYSFNCLWLIKGKPTEGVKLLPPPPTSPRLGLSLLFVLYKTERDTFYFHFHQFENQFIGFNKTLQKQSLTYIPKIRFYLVVQQFRRVTSMIRCQTSFRILAMCSIFVETVIFFKARSRFQNNQFLDTSLLTFPVSVLLICNTFSRGNK